MKIRSEIVEHTTTIHGEEMLSVIGVFPRFILAEVNTHRMLVKNTSSSRAIPLNKMIEAVETNPFIPIEWQKNHKGMQGTEYWQPGEKYEYPPFGNNADAITMNIGLWKQSLNLMLEQAKYLNSSVKGNVTKQLCNRLLEPFMWTTMLITGSRQGWENFFKLRCPQYEYFDYDDHENKNPIYLKSKKEWFKQQNAYDNYKPTNSDWLKINKGNAEIHIMALAESIYDNLNESKPRLIQPGEWHIPFYNTLKDTDLTEEEKVKCSVAMAARTSYTVVGDEKELNFNNLLSLHNRLLIQEPPHSSPFEHCCRAMTDEEYRRHVKGFSKYGFYTGEKHISTFEEKTTLGWCYSAKGYIPYRYLIDNKLKI